MKIPFSSLCHHTLHLLTTVFFSNPLPDVVWSLTHINLSERVPF
jgi:hypothetical protein